MPYTAPRFESGNVSYLKESAALGFIEPHTISGVTMGPQGWVYTINVRPSYPNNTMSFGDRRSMVNGAVLYFQECEFVDLCEALTLAEAHLLQQLRGIRAKLRMYCSTGTDVTCGP